MIESGILIGVSLIQVLLYFWMDKKGVRFPKWMVLSFLLAAQLFVFPQLIFSILGYGQNGCGMPIFGILFFCVVLGGSLNIIVHLSYSYKFRSKNIS